MPRERERISPPISHPPYMSELNSCRVDCARLDFVECACDATNAEFVNERPLARYRPADLIMWLTGANTFCTDTRIDIIVASFSRDSARENWTAPDAGAETYSQKPWSRGTDRKKAPLCSSYLLLRLETLCLNSTKRHLRGISRYIAKKGGNTADRSGREEVY